MEVVRRASGRDGCFAVQGLRPRIALREVRVGQGGEPEVLRPRRAEGRQLRRHGRAEEQQGHRRRHEQDRQGAGREERSSRDHRRRGLERRGQARQGPGDGRSPLEPRVHLRHAGARLPQQPRRGRRSPRRRLRILDAELRDGERQEQRPVLHAGRGVAHHGQGHRRGEREEREAVDPCIRLAAPARSS